MISNNLYAQSTEQIVWKLKRVKVVCGAGNTTPSPSPSGMTAFTPNKDETSNVSGFPVKPKRAFSKFDKELKKVCSTRSRS